MLFAKIDLEDLGNGVKIPASTLLITQAHNDILTDENNKKIGSGRQIHVMGVAFTPAECDTYKATFTKKPNEIKIELPGVVAPLVDRTILEQISQNCGPTMRQNILQYADTIRNVNAETVASLPTTITLEFSKDLDHDIIHRVDGTHTLDEDGCIVLKDDVEVVTATAVNPKQGKSDVPIALFLVSWTIVVAGEFEAPKKPAAASSKVGKAWQRKSYG